MSCNACFFCLQNLDENFIPWRKKDFNSPQGYWKFCVPKEIEFHISLILALIKIIFTPSILFEIT